MTHKEPENKIPLSKHNSTKMGLAECMQKHIHNYFAAHEGELPPSGLYKCVLNEVERSLLQSVLSLVKGNQAKASEILGINRNTVRKKMTDLGIITNKSSKP